MSPTDLIDEFVAAFNRQDVPALLACFTGDGVYHDSFYGRHAGQAGLRHMFEMMFSDGKDYTWTNHMVLADAHRGAAEWSFSYTVTEAVPRSAGRKVRMSGMSLFELKGGKIAGYREYTDVGLALLQLGLAPESLAKVLARRLPA